MKKLISLIILIIFFITSASSFCCGTDEECTHKNSHTINKINTNSKIPNSGCCDTDNQNKKNNTHEERTNNHDDCSCKVKETVYTNYTAKSEYSLQLTFNFINTNQFFDNVNVNASNFTNNYASKFFSYKSLIHLYSSLLC